MTEYVSREAVKGEFNTWIPITQQEKNTLDAIKQTLNAIPAEDVIPTEWIRTYMQESDLSDSVAISKMLMSWEMEKDEVSKV